MHNKQWIGALVFCISYLHSPLQAAAQDDQTNNLPRVLSYNICVEASTFDSPLDLKHRLPAIMKTICTSNPDIVCLQEVRAKVAEKVAAELCNCGYRTQYNSANGGPMSLGLITAYKPGRLLCESVPQWISETPNECSGNSWYPFGRIYTISRFRECMQNGMTDPTKDPLYVINVHLGLSEEEKEYSAQKLLTVMRALKRVILVGDFNFFYDKRGAEQRRTYQDAGLQDLLQERPTFFGYSTERFLPATKADMTRLDGAFVKGIENMDAEVLDYDKLNDDLSNRDEMPSDHLPILLYARTKPSDEANLLN